jgi:hypothetical protein
VFAAALLNSQPMGFYAPAQIVRDAQEHGVEVRDVDINASDWDCTLEPSSPLPPQAQRSGGEGSGVGGLQIKIEETPPTRLLASLGATLPTTLTRGERERKSACGASQSSTPATPL